MRKIYIVLIVLLVGLRMSAQQDPQYTQYMYNMSVINPAYAGSNEKASFGLLYRNQWEGFDGAPKTFSFFGSGYLNDKIGVGLSVISDKIGPVSESNVYGDLSYTLNLNNNRHLAFGLKAGMTFHNIGLTGLDVVTPGDPLFSENVNASKLNIGAGFLYYTNKFYIAASMPNILESVHLDINGLKYGSEYRHYFITGGYLVHWSEHVKFKPSFLIKSAWEVPTSFDLNANVLFYDKLEIGASYRLDDSFSGLVNLAIAPNIRIGYAYDAVIPEIGRYAPASHEFLLLIDIKSSKDSSRPKRFF